MASWIDFASIKQECEDDTSLETWPDLVKKSADIYGAELLKNVKIEGASERPQEVEDSHGFLPTAGRNFIKVEFDEEDRRKSLDFNRLKFEGGANERPALTGSSRGCPATADQNFVEVELDEEDVGEDQNFVEVVLDEEDVGEDAKQRKRRLQKARQKYQEKRANEDEEASMPDLRNDVIV
ncbi:unnamed protein product [Lampetra planeri]